MKIKITLRDHCAASSRSDALSKIVCELGPRVTITGDIVVAEDGPDEIRVTKILNRERVCYSRTPAVV
jgi:hypothetical protein